MTDSLTRPSVRTGAPSPKGRAGQAGNAVPYERNRAVWFLWGAAIINTILLKLSNTDKHNTENAFACEGVYHHANFFQIFQA